MCWLYLEGLFAIPQTSSATTAATIDLQAASQCCVETNDWATPVQLLTLYHMYLWDSGRCCLGHIACSICVLQKQTSPIKFTQHAHTNPMIYRYHERLDLASIFTKISLRLSTSIHSQTLRLTEHMCYICLFTIKSHCLKIILHNAYINLRSI